MRLLAQITEDEMIAVFLKAEIQSERFAQQIINKLDQDGQERRLVDRPDCTNPLENAYRRQLLASYRPYVLEELAPQTVWYRAMLRREELMEVCYIDYSYWNELSGYTQLPRRCCGNDPCWSLDLWAAERYVYPHGTGRPCRCAVS